MKARVIITYSYMGGSTPFAATVQIPERGVVVTGVSELSYEMARKNGLALAEKMPAREIIEI